MLGCYSRINSGCHARRIHVVRQDKSDHGGKQWSRERLYRESGGRGTMNAFIWHRDLGRRENRHWISRQHRIRQGMIAGM